MSLEGGRVLQRFPKHSVVVDFSIDGKVKLSVIADERLCAGVYDVDTRQQRAPTYVGHAASY